MVFQLLICLNLIAPRLVKADFAVASQDPKGGKPNTSWRPTTTAEITRFVGINGATDRWNQWTSHKKGVTMPRHRSPKIWMPRSFLPRRIHQREGTEGTTADTAQGPQIRGLIATKHCTKTFPEAKNLQQLQRNWSYLSMFAVCWVCTLHSVATENLAAIENLTAETVQAAF